MIEKFKQFKIKLSSLVQFDKLAHSFYCTLLYIPFSLYNSLLALIVVLIVAIGTEIADKQGSGNAEFKDLLFSIAIPVLLFLRDMYVQSGN